MLGGPFRAALARVYVARNVRMAHSAAVGAVSLSTHLRPPAPERPKPASPTYYTTKPSYVDTLQMLDQLTREVKRALEQAYILAPNSRPPPLPRGTAVSWLSRERLSSKLGMALRASQYGSVSSRLSLLLRYRQVAVEHFLQGAEQTTAHQRELAQQVVEVLDSFMSDHRREQLAQQASETNGSSARGLIDEHGRAYARGRRKESSARVWMVRIKDGVPAGQILVNNAPLHTYFLRTAHREQVTWPLKLAGVLGMYHVFAIVRGGGASGQAGAIAHGLANALVAALGAAEGEQAADIQARVRHVLSKDGVLLRDPRMVERKKPGLAKARKAYTWVKR
ncbi:37S ribosomal protein S9, mitochondrial [Malassezia nana]|uniref:Small ribosomal subunit protein uS9m n=1 Tax=Malassezia nana TaxID=180528 RepID=A0AAF0EMG8_9BASI|nr:37S ribosomal protein S9, mitochondrial [Malassezia nana]